MCFAKSRCLSASPIKEQHVDGQQGGLPFTVTFAFYVYAGVAGLERLLPLVVAGASRGAAQIEQVGSTNVSQCSDDRASAFRLLRVGATGSQTSSRARLDAGTHMGRPISGDGETYRACLDCCARRRFDPERWLMYGPYYF